MKKALSYIGYTLAYGGWYIMSLLPFRVLYLLSDGLYLLVAHVVRYRHKIIYKNLRESFPEKSEAEVKQLERQFYKLFCDYLVETIKMMTMTKRQLMRHLRFTHLDKLNEVLANGQSAAIYLGHIFNWEWITSLPYWVPDGVQCSELYHPLENEYFDKLFKYVREKHDALCISMKESLRYILKYKRDNKAIVVGLISDQVPQWGSIHLWVDFLHHDTPVLTGGERIVRHTNMAVFYGDVRRVKRGYYECEMKLMTEKPKEMDENEITKVYFRMLEETIRRDPANWLWSHNRWKRTHKEFDELFEVVNGKVMKKENLHGNA